MRRQIETLALAGVLLAASWLLPAKADFGPIPGVTTAQLNAAAATNLASMNTVINTKLGSAVGFGHTTTPMTLNFAAVALGGTVVTASSLVDPVSGSIPGVGSWCAIAPSTATPFTAQMTISCTITAAGVASIRAVPVGIAALGAQSVTGNLFWWW